MSVGVGDVVIVHCWIGSGEGVWEKECLPSPSDAKPKDPHNMTSAALS